MFSHRYFLRTKLVALCALGTLIAPAIALAAEPTEHETLSLKAAPLFQIGEFSVTNSMLASWIVALAVILFAQIATRNIKTVPTGAQNFWEWLVESLYNFLESIIGRELVQKTFWFFATIFIFILFTNWAGLIPGVGTVGWGHVDPATGAFQIDRPLFRGANADLNMTSAMAVIFFVLWLIWALQANGIGGFLMHLFGPKGETSGVLKILMVVVFFLVGWLEIISILVPADFAQLSSVRKYLRGRKYSRRDVAHGPGSGLAASDSVLLFGNPGGVRPGPGLYVIDRYFHALDCATQPRRRSTLKFRRSQRVDRQKPNTEKL